MVLPSLRALDALTPPRVAVLRLTYGTRGHVLLPSPPASVWRGQLGAFLHRLAPEAEHVQGLSLYQRLFRTPRTAVDLPGGFSAHERGRLGLAGRYVPHPFVLRLATPSPPGEPLHLGSGTETAIEMLLFEDAVATLPPLCAAFETLGTQGLGAKTDQPGGRRRRGRVQLLSAQLRLGLGGEDASPEAASPVTRALYDGRTWSLPPACGPALFAQAAAIAPSAPSALAPDRPVTLALRTPLRLKHRGALVTPERLTVGALGAAYVRRLVGLAVCYGPAPPTPAEVQALRDAFHALGDATTLDAGATGWVSDSRYSTRQGQRHPTGGLTGTLALDGPPPVRRAWRRLARHGARLHLGTKTALGLGRVEPLPATNAAPGDASPGDTSPEDAAA